MGSAEFAEGHQGTRDGAACQPAGEVIELGQCVEVRQRLQLAIQRADDIYRGRAALLLCLDANRKLVRRLGDVVDHPRITLEDQIAHLLRLLDRAQLRRQENQVLGSRTLGDRSQQRGGAKR